MDTGGEMAKRLTKEREAEIRFLVTNGLYPSGADVEALVAEIDALRAELANHLYVTLEEWCEAAMENQGRSLDRESLNRVLARRAKP